MRRICVFCGASPGRRPAYLELATSVGSGLAARGIGLVYGGGRVGMMGAVADAALASGGDVIGVIPRGLVDRELAHPGVTELRVVETLHERKAVMSELADGFIALPGGLGTLEELAEVASWAQLGLHAKPIGLLGPDGYWDALAGWLDHAVDEGFVAPGHRALVVIDRDLDTLLARFAGGSTRPPARWSRQPG
ncbi:MAG TPA: TIGR00730 family Rossman fold protein [Candidatus Limnocylindrales bacterium]|nr:TIGR00730 family Rossman fold protein [Candidatus Limnocylindrales bacterium]